MIIVRSPLRITLGGGGTDLRSYYREHEVPDRGGDRPLCLHHGASNLSHRRLSQIFSKIEHVNTIDELQHPIITEALKLRLRHAPIEITTLADIPAGTGLGSSGSFTTALLKRPHTQARNMIHPHELAEQACHIEIERWASRSANRISISRHSAALPASPSARMATVEAWPLEDLDDETRYALEDNLLLFFTGYSRSASAILQEQDSAQRARCGQ